MTCWPIGIITCDGDRISNSLRHARMTGSRTLERNHVPKSPDGRSPVWKPENTETPTVEPELRAGPTSARI